MGALRTSVVERFLGHLLELVISFFDSCIALLLALSWCFTKVAKI